jgi:hypothetical protein
MFIILIIHVILFQTFKFLTAFITGVQTTIDMSSSIHFQVSNSNIAAYQMLSINNDTGSPTYENYGILGSENSGLANSSTYAELKQTLIGYNFIQMFELYYTAGVTYQIGESGHGNLHFSGFISSLEN